MQDVWTLCRIFKRIPSFKKYIPTNNNNIENPNDNNFNQISLIPQNPNNNSNVTFTSKLPNTNFQSQPYSTDHLIHLETKPKPSEQYNPSLTLPHASSFEPYSIYPSSFWNGINGEGGGDNNFTTDGGGWDELRPVVQFAVDPSFRFYECI